MKYKFPLGVEVEIKQLNSGRKVTFIDNKLPNDYWEQSRMRQLIWN